MHYLIAYHLVEEYDSLPNAVTNIDENAILILPNAWIVESDLSRDEIHSKLDKLLQEGDSLVVNAIESADFEQRTLLFVIAFAAATATFRLLTGNSHNEVASTDYARNVLAKGSRRQRPTEIELRQT